MLCHTPWVKVFTMFFTFFQKVNCFSTMRLTLDRVKNLMGSNSIFGQRKHNQWYLIDWKKLLCLPNGRFTNFSQWLLKKEILGGCTKSIGAITTQKMKFPIKDFFSKCDQICSFLRIWSHLLKKSLMEDFIFFKVGYVTYNVAGVLENQCWK